MNKKIAMSLSVIAAVSAVVIGGTGAFFSDSETSTGNTFTAGAIDLKVDSQQHYNNAVCVNNLWQLEPGASATVPQYPVIGTACSGTWGQNTPGVDITNEKFFNFGDIKPGDSGENTISLHVVNNDAYMCATVSNLVNLDNDMTEPESSADVTPAAGDLQQNLVMKIWADNSEGTGWVKGDNVWQAGEPVLYEGMPQAGTWPLYTPSTGALVGGTTGYLGVAWSLPFLTGNEVQTDSMTGDISFKVEQARNNGNFTCSQEAVRPTVGALLSAYVAPTTCNVTVDDNGGNSALDTIQEGIDAATAGQTVCVKAGTYTQDVNINKSLTLVGDGSSLTSLTGVGTGYGGALTVAAGIDNVTIEGFTVNGTGESAVYLTSNNDNVDVLYNRIVAATAKNALLTGGQQTNSTLSSNVFEGSASQLVYVNGSASLGGANASSNVDFMSNTFGGTATGPLLGIEANGSSVTLNKFSGTTSYTSIESWEGNNLVNQNNFNADLAVGPVHVTNGVAGGTQFPDTLNAENNWWGDTDPSDNDGGLVDFTPFEVAAFPQN